jgi:hypothetical protein
MYSRPTTKQVDAVAPIPKPMEIEVGKAPTVDRSRDGRLYDNRNPNTLIQNGQARAAEVTNFIEKLTDVAKPIIKDQLTKQANQQVGELLATQDPVALIRSSNPEQRELIRRLSPQAQDILQDTAARASVRLYQDTLSAERAQRSAVLDTENFSPEDRAKAAADAKAKALQVSGITSVQPSYLVKYGDVLGETDATLEGLSYKARSKAKDTDETTVYTRGIESTLESWSLGRNQAINNGTVEQFSGVFKNTLQEGIAGASARYTPKEQAEIWDKAIRNQVLRLTQTGKYDEAMGLLYTMQGASALGVAAPNGTPFFQQQLDSGYTLEYTINGLLDQTEASYKKWQGEQILEQNGDIIREALRGGDVTAQFQAALSDPRLTPQQMLLLGQTVNQARDIGGQESNEQLMREAELRYTIAQGSYDPKKMWEQVKASGLTPQQVYRLAGTITKGADESTQLIARTRVYMGNETKTSAAALAKLAGLSGKEVEEYERYFTNDITKAVEKRYADKIAKGETVTEQSIRDIWRNEMEAATKRRAKDVTEFERIRELQSPKNRVMGELNELQSNLQRDKGEFTVMSFPKQVRVDFSNTFPNKKMSTEALSRYMVDRMNAVKEGDKPVFPEAPKTLRQLIDYTRDKAQGRLPSSGIVPMEYTMFQSGMDAARLFRSWITPQQQAAPKPTNPAQPATKPQKVSSAPQQNPMVQLVSQGLSSVAQVFTPPAAAATLDAQPAAAVQNVNPDAIALLNRLWKGQQRVDLRTPPLPQVAASAPVGFIPTAITNDKHPIFVAIGIAEGTRTPTGGYTKAYYGHTDPGNGARNVGTVSGQQGGSPALTDRRWMGTLTATATRVAPILQRMGLQPGTQGWNRVLFNVLDLNVQAPAALVDFIRKIPQVIQQGATVEAIAKARTDSFINPATGRLEAGGFGNSYNRLFQDQRSRAGVWDYRRRV